MRRWWAGCGWVIWVVWLVGCQAATAVDPLPTLMAVSVLPNLPTSTPTPRPSPTTSPTPTLQPTPTATSTPTATATPTPNPMPPYLIAGEIVVPYVETPPGAVDCDGSGVLFRSRYPSDYGGPWRYYTAYLPPCYGQQGRTYPVLYLFHGSIQTDSQWAELGIPLLLGTGIKDGRYPPFLVIMPNNGELGNQTSGGDRSIEGVTVNTLIPFIDATYCTWATHDGRGMGGISRGGYWALMIAFRHPDLVRSVSGHSSHLRLETDSVTYNPLATYATADLTQMRIWLDWGEKDFLYYGQQTLHESLLAAHISHEAHINSGGHNQRYWEAHVQEYLDWHAAAWSQDTAVGGATPPPPCTH